MKISKKITKLPLITFVIVFSSSSPAAKVDVLENSQPESAFTSQIPGWGIVTPDFYLDQGEQYNNSSYESVLNLIKQKKFAEAENRITALIKQTPNDPHIYNLQALNELNLGKNNSAKQSYQKVIELDDKNLLPYFGLAAIAINDKQLDSAKAYVDKILLINDKNVDAYFLLSDIATLQGNNKEAEQVLLKGLNKVQGNIQAETRFITRLGIFYVNQKQAKKILPLSQAMVKRYPENKSALSGLAGAQYLNNQKQQAAETLSKIVQQDKNDIKHRLLLATVLSELPDNEERVIVLLDEAYQINPVSPQILVRKADYFIKLKRYQEALDTAERIEQSFPKVADSKRLQGEIFVAQGQLFKALDAYQQAYQIKPQVIILLKMTDLMSILEKTSDAIKLLKKEANKYPDDQSVTFKLATLYQKQGDYKQAEKYYKKILKKQPEHTFALNNLAWIYQIQNNPDALKIAEQAYGLAPKEAVIADTYGYILVKQGKVKKGLEILLAASQNAPSLREIQFHIAEAYSLSGKKQQAIEILERITAQKGTFPGRSVSEQLLLQLKAGG